MPRRCWFLPLVVALACNPTAPAAIQPKAPPAGEVLYLQEGDRIRVRDAATGEIRSEVPRGVISPDWTSVYVLDNATVRAIGLPTGETLRAIDLPGEFVMATADPSGKLTGLSQDGRTLVLPQRQSDPARFAVLDTAFDTPPRYVDVSNGNVMGALAAAADHILRVAAG